MVREKQILGDTVQEFQSQQHLFSEEMLKIEYILMLIIAECPIR